MGSAIREIYLFYDSAPLSKRIGRRIELGETVWNAFPLAAFGFRPLYKVHFGSDEN